MHIISYLSAIPRGYWIAAGTVTGVGAVLTSGVALALFIGLIAKAQPGRSKKLSELRAGWVDIEQKERIELLKRGIELEQKVGQGELSDQVKGLVPQAAHAWFHHLRELCDVVEKNPSWWDSKFITQLANIVRLDLGSPEGFIWQARSPKTGKVHYLIGSVHMWYPKMLDNPHYQRVCDCSIFLFENWAVKNKGGLTDMDSQIYWEAKGISDRRSNAEIGVLEDKYRYLFCAKEERETLGDVDASSMPHGAAVEKLREVQMLSCFAAGDFSNEWRFDENVWNATRPIYVDRRNLQWCFNTLYGPGLTELLLNSTEPCCIVAGCAHFIYGGENSLLSLFNVAGLEVERLYRPRVSSN